jgi:hypothetical protein
MVYEITLSCSQEANHSTVFCQINPVDILILFSLQIHFISTIHLSVSITIVLSSLEFFPKIERYFEYSLLNTHK